MLFGTDGIRGLVDIDLDSFLAYNVGKSLAKIIINDKKKKKVVIGRDTRTSSELYMYALSLGLIDYGVDVDIIDIVSTPIISYLSRTEDYSSGVMITASHNYNSYNGIKIFDEFGQKYNKKQEKRIEFYINKKLEKPFKKGKICVNTDIINNYIDNITNTFKVNLSGLTIVMDCANGSNYKIAPKIFKKLKVNVIEINCDNNGQKINKKCGAGDISSLVQEVKLHKADFGIAFDGDGDRLRVVSRDKILSGDELLLIFAKFLSDNKKLENKTVAGTIMSNLGFEKELNNLNLNLIRSDVGDKNVINLMKQNKCIIGGEPSGHICLLSYLPTCDALYNSVMFLYICKKTDNKILHIINNNILYPSTIKNISISKQIRDNFSNNKNLMVEIEKVKNDYPNNRIVVRPSGTEPVIRIYVEGLSEIENLAIVDEIEYKIKNSK